MHTKHIVVVGASAGGIEALRELVANLPANFPAAVCVVLHTSPQSPGVLDAILSRAGPLRATNGRDRERLNPGHIYVAPPDCHLLVEPGIIRVTKGPRENRFRPAIDPLFRSAAQVYGPRAIGVVLTGNLDDGTAGLWTLKQLGGTAIVQHPDEAMFPDMPRNAMSHVQVDYAVPLAEIPPLLVHLTEEPVSDSTRVPAAEAVSDSMEVEVKIAKEQNSIEAGVERIGEPSSFACPECHGVLLQLKEGGRTRFRCHTGHAYSLESLLAAVGEGIEESLWMAIRALEEGALLLGSMAAHLKTSHEAEGAESLLSRAADAHRQSDVIRRLVGEREPLAAK
jgi:two-component system, chemotaxis family, protein-glutamate methylesterase/glutaminase